MSGFGARISEKINFLTDGKKRSDEFFSTSGNDMKLA
jgi:hypothetical protein